MAQEVRCRGLTPPEMKEAVLFWWDRALPSMYLSCVATGSVKNQMRFMMPDRQVLWMCKSQCHVATLSPILLSAALV